MTMNENDKQAEPLGVTISPMMYRFLMGEGSIDGCWFGDRHSTFKGAFWWRSMLRHSAEAYTHPAQPVQPAVAQEPVKAVLSENVLMIARVFKSGKMTPDSLEGWTSAVEVHESDFYTAPPAAAINEQILEALQAILDSYHGQEYLRNDLKENACAAIAAAETEKAKGGV